MIALPDGFVEIDTFLGTLDLCWMAGFSQLSSENRISLSKLQQIFHGTPLEHPLLTAVEAINRGIYQPEYFRTIAAARSSLQGTQYTHLRHAIEQALQRQSTHGTIPLPMAETLTPPAPLHKAAAHWLMEVALKGFARLDPGEISAFDSTLIQIQNQGDMLPLSVLLNGFTQALMGAVPVGEPASAPLFRWVDLWQRTMMMTGKQPSPSNSRPVNGELYLMGVELRSQPRFISTVFYGILSEQGRAYWVRTTFTAYKVNAIDKDQSWLLVPQTQPLLQALKDGTTLQLTGMPLLSTGDLVWDETYAQEHGSYKLMEVARQYLSIGESPHIEMPLTLPEKRHPVHLAVPAAFSSFKIQDDHVVTDALRLPIDARRVYDTELTGGELGKYNQLVGLIRYDNQQISIQPIAAVNKSGRTTFIGSATALKIFDKPPKTNTVAILQERASRLLREK